MRRADAYHRGVCGCQCCDGTPLSSTCLPYYPQCGAAGAVVPAPVIATPAPKATVAPPPTPSGAGAAVPAPIIPMPVPKAVVAPAPAPSTVAPTGMQEASVAVAQEIRNAQIAYYAKPDGFREVLLGTLCAKYLGTERETVARLVYTLLPDVHRFPNSTLTPGDVFSVSAGQVCVSGYSSKVRSVSLALKKSVYAAYGIPYPQPSGSYELDHFVPLELGGSNDAKNLWPEAAEPRPGFHEKDQVENYLHKLVCSGKMTLLEAQQAIESDWYSVFLTIE